MRFFAIFSAFMFLLFFTACDGNSGKKADADTPGNDSILTDEDLVTDELIPDEEEDVEPDETDLDIKDADIKDGDIVDKDIIDTDTTDEDLVEVEPTDDGEPTDESEVEPDTDEVVLGPCAADPCAAIAHTDGTCTEVGEDFVCGCLENYLWDEQMKECLAATQVVACTNTLPDNGHWAAPNEDGMIEQVWDGDSWEPPADTCAWECDANYDKQGETCVAGVRRVDCENAIPDHAVYAGANADGKFEQVWDGDSWEPATFDCEWACALNYTWDGSLCVADTQRVDCTNIPANAHGTGDNADGKIDQVWDGDSWEPPADTCEWECNKGYVLSQSGDACVWQQVIYVKWDATGANDGTSWENAFTDLTTAIEKAVAGQEIWVAMGTYVPSKCLTTAQETCAQRPRNRTFTLPSGVAIYGGFAGTETSRDERDWASYETILSGDFNGDDTWDDINEVWLNTEENAYHVIQVIADMGMFPQDALLDGFTITHGYADDPLGIDNKGAGLAATDNENSAEITIRHCIFKDNIAAGTYSGGGAVSFANMDPIIEDTTFLANSADFAGGALSIGNGSVTLARTEFLDNTTDGNGGAIMADQSSILITEGTFLRNSAAKNGGVINANASDITIDEDSFFEDNGVTGDTDSDGGVFAVSAGTLAITSSSFYQNNAVNGASVLSATGTEISITDSAFYKNSVATASDRMYTMRIKNNVLTIHGSLFVSNTGSPLNLEGVSATIEGTEFNDNTAVNAGAIQFQGTQPLSINRCWFRNNAADIPLGGLAGVGGALFLNGMSGTPTVTITNSVFDGNHANLWGGAAAFVMASPTVVNCTFEGNTASVDGHSIAFVGSNAAINNTILWDAVTQITSAGPYNFPPSNPTFSYSDVFGSGGSGASWVLPFGTDGGGNIDEDPLFVGGTGSDPLFLMDTSPCKDTGNDALVPAGITTDLLGSNRFYGPVDMGAYEWWE